MFPWGGHWPESCCICLAEGLLTFLDVKEQFVHSSKHNCCWQHFHPQPCDRSVCKGASRYLLGFGRLGFRGQQHTVRWRWVSMQRGKRWTPNSLAWMYESSLRPCVEILFPVRCCLTPPEWWGLFLEDSSRRWQKQQKLWQVWRWDGAVAALWLVFFCPYVTVRIKEYCAFCSVPNTLKHL